MHSNVAKDQKTKKSKKIKIILEGCSRSKSRELWQ